MADDQGTLLIVDDDPMDRAMLRRYLTPHGFQVTEAGDGPEALALLESQQFDVVLLDILMPGMTGLEVLLDLRRRRSVADQPVIMATAKDRSDDVVKALQAGANDYLTKP